MLDQRSSKDSRCVQTLVAVASTIICSYMVRKGCYLVLLDNVPSFTMLLNRCGSPFVREKHSGGSSVEPFAGPY